MTGPRPILSPSPSPSFQPTRLAPALKVFRQYSSCTANAEARRGSISPTRATYGDNADPLPLAGAPIAAGVLEPVPLSTALLIGLGSA